MTIQLSRQVADESGQEPITVPELAALDRAGEVELDDKSSEASSDAFIDGPRVVERAEIEAAAWRLVPGAGLGRDGDYGACGLSLRGRPRGPIPAVRAW